MVKTKQYQNGTANEMQPSESVDICLFSYGYSLLNVLLLGTDLPEIFNALLVYLIKTHCPLIYF